ncbi:MAG TPA: hypothetical protein VHC47_01765 [Mucilaginibacter sp.]|nr:hypothetical protein [Mucilaginibacter sp.]
MKPLTFLLAIFLLSSICTSCGREPARNNTKQKEETPKPLQDDSKDFSLLSKRSADGNLVDAIYDDLLKKNTDLKELQDEMDHFNAAQTDSLNDFLNYDSKSKNYYSSAMSILDRVSDTVLKRRLHELILASEKNYDNKTAVYQSLIAKVQSDKVIADDYYLTLELASTLPVIEQYQQDNISAGKSVISLSNDAEKIKNHTKKLEKAYESKVVEK